MVLRALFNRKSYAQFWELRVRVRKSLNRNWHLSTVAKSGEDAAPQTIPNRRALDQNKVLVTSIVREGINCFMYLKIY